MVVAWRRPLGPEVGQAAEEARGPTNADAPSTKSYGGEQQRGQRSRPEKQLPGTIPGNDVTRIRTAAALWQLAAGLAKAGGGPTSLKWPRESEQGSHRCVAHQTPPACLECSGNLADGCGRAAKMHSGDCRIALVAASMSSVNNFIVNEIGGSEWWHGRHVVIAWWQRAVAWWWYGAAS